MVMIKVSTRFTLNWVQEDVAKFLQCSSIDSILPSRPESGASLYLYLYFRLIFMCVFVRIFVSVGLYMSEYLVQA